MLCLPHRAAPGSQNARVWACPLCHAMKAQPRQHRHLRLFLPSGSSRTQTQLLPPFRSQGNAPPSLLRGRGATFCVLTSHEGPTVSSPTSVLRVEGIPSFPTHYATFLYSCRTSFRTFFLVVPVCPVPFLGHDILSHFGAAYSLIPTTSQLSSSFLPLVTSQTILTPKLPCFHPNASCRPLSMGYLHPGNCPTAPGSPSSP